MNFPTELIHDKQQARPCVQLSHGAEQGQDGSAMSALKRLLCSTSSVTLCNTARAGEARVPLGLAQPMDRQQARPAASASPLHTLAHCVAGTAGKYKD